MFRVFGVTQSQAEALAVKKVSRYKGKGKQRTELSDDEYQAKLKQQIKHQMRVAKPKQLSHDLSTPAICKEYMRLIKEDARLIIMHRVPGPINPKTRRAKMEWKVYAA